MADVPLALHLLYGPQRLMNRLLLSFTVHLCPHTTAEQSTIVRAESCIITGRKLPVEGQVSHHVMPSASS